MLCSYDGGRGLLSIHNALRRGSGLGQLGLQRIYCKEMGCGRRVSSCLERHKHSDLLMLSVVAMVAVMANFASGLSRDSAFLGYSERPLVIPQYHGLVSLNPNLSSECLVMLLLSVGCIFVEIVL